MKPEFPEPEVICPSDYRRMKAARDILQGQLNETQELLALREEQIEVQRQKLSKMAQLQSQLDNMQYEVQFLQNELDEQRQKLTGQRQLEKDLIQELKMGGSKAQQYDTVREQVVSLQTLVKISKQEADEMAALNQELLVELKQVGQLHSSLWMERQENRILREKVDELEKRRLVRSGF